MVKVFHDNDADLRELEGQTIIVGASLVNSYRISATGTSALASCLRPPIVASSPK